MLPAGENIANCRAPWNCELCEAWLVILFCVVYIISTTVVLNHVRIIQRPFKEYQGLGSTPRYSYLIGFGWSPGIGIFRSSQVILMGSQGWGLHLAHSWRLSSVGWMNDSNYDFLSLPLCRSVLCTGWKFASCVGLRSGAWLFLELLCESIWTFMFRRCSQWLTCWWAAPLKATVAAALQLLHLDTGLASLSGGWPGWGWVEGDWNSLASDRLPPIRSG